MKALYLGILSLFGTTLMAQNLEDNWNETKKDPNLGSQVFIQYKLHVGNHLYTGVTFADYLEDGYVGNELRLGWRTSGKEDWEKALNYPFYGVGIYSGNIGDPQAMGNPAGIYGFFHWPILRRPNHHFNFELAAGLTYDLVAFNAETNPDNDAIGSSVAVYFNVNVGGDITINPKWDVTYGLDLTHFSNGRTFTPNFGVNMAGINVGARYNFNPIRKGTKLFDPEYEPARRPVLDRSPRGPKPKYSQISGYGALGTVMFQTIEGRGPRYLTWTVYGEYRRRFSHISAYTIGFDWMYDGSLFENYKNDGFPADEVTNLDLMLGGIHLGHSLYIQRFRIETQLGVYVVKPQPVDWKGAWYMRVSLRYAFTERFFGQIGLKTMDGGAADWVEWGIGYHLFDSRNKK